jgi:hypothetical protein
MPPSRIVHSSVIRALGADTARPVELGLRRGLFQRRIQIASVVGVIGGPHDLHVLLRHRPRSIPLGGYHVRVHVGRRSARGCVSPRAGELIPQPGDFEGFVPGQIELTPRDLAVREPGDLPGAGL